MSTLTDEIKRLKEERHAVILAHNYVRPEVQDIADFTGDSLELSIKAKAVNAEVIVFCGVRFMAETAKLLSPQSMVLLPNSDAGCPMADMADPEPVANYRKAHPDAIFVAYVNSTAAVKAQVDICCTSGNAEKIIQSLPKDREILFLPDRNLGGNISGKLGVDMDLWPGFCPTHNRVTVEMIEKARAAAPDALVLVHPECTPEVVAAADQALSTGGILKFVRESDAKRFIIGTEAGILHRLRNENPGREFLPLQPEMICPNMKKITLEDVARSLRDLTEQIEIAPELREAAVRPILRMLEVK